MRTRLAVVATGVLGIAALIGPGGGSVRSGDLIGKFTDRGDNYAIPYTQIEICPADGSSCRTAVTDRDGGFRVQGLAPGRYNLRAPTKTGTYTESVNVGTSRSVIHLQAD